MVLYFAYGSNLWRPRLDHRVGAVAPPRVAYVNDFALAWHKRSKDGSGKCNIVAAPGSVVFGALYSLTISQVATLDLFEGVGKGYRRDDGLLVHCDGQSLVSSVYIADPSYVDDQLQPYDWYHALVMAGARDLGFPAWYVEMLERQSVAVDPLAERGRIARGILHAAPINAVPSDVRVPHRH